MRTATAAAEQRPGASARRQSARTAYRRPGLVRNTDSPSPSGWKNGKVGIDRRQVEQEVVEVHRDVGQGEQPLIARCSRNGGSVASP